MRILLEWPRSSVYDPTSFPGGVEKWVTHVFNLLKRSEHSVKLLVPSDSTASDPDVILGPLPSRPYDKTKSHSYKFKPFYEFVDTIDEEFDVILLTSMITSGVLRKNWEHLLHKIVYIQHYYEMCDPVVNNFTAWLNHLAIIKAGGKVLTPNEWVSHGTRKAYDVRKDGREWLKRIHPWEREKWYGIADEIGLYNGSFDIIHHLSDAVPLKALNEKKVVFIGRPVDEKGIFDAAQTLLSLAEEGYECHVFTRDEQLAKQRTEQVMDLLKQSSVNLHINTPHGEIMEHLADTHILLWPTLKETVGIVGYEGTIHGCKVIYKIDPPDCYLKDFGFKGNWKNWKQLLAFVRQVEAAEFDRQAVSNHFKEKYTFEKDLERLEIALSR
jgi:glycosyltransferase involved in cell wall biosynthesis